MLLHEELYDILDLILIYSKALLHTTAILQETEI